MYPISNDQPPLEYETITRRFAISRRARNIAVVAALLALIGVFSYLATACLPRVGTYFEGKRLFSAAARHFDSPGTLVFERHRDESLPRVARRVNDYDRLLWLFGHNFSPKHCTLFLGPARGANRLSVFEVGLEPTTSRDRWRIYASAGQFQVRNFWDQDWTFEGRISRSWELRASGESARAFAAIPDPQDPNHHWTFEVEFDEQVRTFDIWNRPGKEFKIEEREGFDQPPATAASSSSP